MTVKSIHFENAPQRVHQEEIFFFGEKPNQKRVRREKTTSTRISEWWKRMCDGRGKKHDLHWFDRLLVRKQLNHKTASWNGKCKFFPVSYTRQAWAKDAGTFQTENWLTYLKLVFRSFPFRFFFLSFVRLRRFLLPLLLLMVNRTSENCTMIYISFIFVSFRHNIIFHE